MSVAPEKSNEERVIPGIAAPGLAPMDASSRNGNDERSDRLLGIKQALLVKRSELISQQATQLNALYAPDKHHLADLEEMSSDTVDTDSLCTLVDMESSTLEQIDAALEKLESGTYGICELCEQPISPERLEVLPFAALCVDCQRRKELEG